MLNNQLWNLRQQIENGIKPNLELFEFEELLKNYENDETQSLIDDLTDENRAFEEEAAKAEKQIQTVFDNAEKSFSSIQGNISKIVKCAEQAKELAAINELPQEFIDVFDELLESICDETDNIQEKNDDILSDIEELKELF
jgi:hypothetical protein